MSKVKAHISFDEKRVEKPESRVKLLAEIKKRSQISDINQKRFDLYGVLTGTIEESEVEKVRAIPGVVAVEVDEERHLS